MSSFLASFAVFVVTFFCVMTGGSAQASPSVPAADTAERLFSAEGREVTMLRQELIAYPPQDILSVTELLTALAADLQKRPDWLPYREDPRDAALMLIEKSLRGWEYSKAMKNTSSIPLIRQHLETLIHSVAAVSPRKMPLLKIAESTNFWSNEEINQLILADPARAHDPPAALLSPKQVLAELRELLQNSKPWQSWGTEKRDQQLKKIHDAVHLWRESKTQPTPKDSTEIGEHLTLLLEKFPRAQKRRELILGTIETGDFWSPKALPFLLRQMEKSGPQYVRPTLLVGRQLKSSSREELKRSLRASRKNRAVSLALLYLLDGHTSEDLQELLQIFAQNYRQLKKRQKQIESPQEIAAFPAGPMSGEGFAFADLGAWEQQVQIHHDEAPTLSLHAANSAFSQNYEALLIALNKVQDRLKSSQTTSIETQAIARIKAQENSRDDEFLTRLTSGHLTQALLDQELRELYLGPFSCEGQLF